jgi:hypothetical protein
VTTLDLIGVDGSTWHLMDLASPAHLLGGMGGLHLPPATNRWAQTARGSGRRWKGSVLDARRFHMAVRVGDPYPPFRIGDEWRTLDGQFWDALSTDASATLVMNGQRRLAFRLDDDNDFDFPKDPALLGKAAYTIGCIADRPEWTGAPVEASFNFAPTVGANYYGTGEGPPFVISTPDITRHATISNIGDLPAYPVWRIIGPATTAVVGVGDRLVTIPFALQAGQQVIIDTEAQTIVDGTGISLWPSMGSTPVDFAPVPPGGNVEITIGLEDGTSSSEIQVSLTPRYRRAWG